MITCMPWKKFCVCNKQTRNTFILVAVGRPNMPKSLKKLQSSSKNPVRLRRRSSVGLKKVIYPCTCLFFCSKLGPDYNVLEMNFSNFFKIMTLFFIVLYFILIYLQYLTMHGYKLFSFSCARVLQFLWCWKYKCLLERDKMYSLKNLIFSTEICDNHAVKFRPGSRKPSQIVIPLLEEGNKNAPKTHLTPYLVNYDREAFSS